MGLRLSKFWNEQNKLHDNGLVCFEQNQPRVEKLPILLFYKMSLQLSYHDFYCNPLLVNEKPFERLVLHIDIEREEEKTKVKVTRTTSRNCKYTLRPYKRCWGNFDIPISFWFVAMLVKVEIRLEHSRMLPSQ